MAKQTYPRIKHLLITWLILMILTAASMVSGQALGGDTTLAPLGYLSVAILLAITFFKARQVLWIFLNLRLTTAGWKTLFIVLIGGLLSLVYISYSIGLAFDLT